MAFPSAGIIPGKLVIVVRGIQLFPVCDNLHNFKEFIKIPVLLFCPFQIFFN